MPPAAPPPPCAPPPPPSVGDGAHAPATFPDVAPHLDIVIPTIRHLDFLDDWRGFLAPYHLIVVQDGDPAAPRVRVPAGYSADVYNRADVERLLGPRAACISYKDSACRCFGFLVSKKRYVFTIDDDCFVARDPDGARINALKHHIRNLLTPSTPHFFNTLYDPFTPGADFVRGYPFSLRSGSPTAISHGLWLGVPDYDAPTQLAKPRERNTRYVNAVLTVPAGALYPMCGMNLAFDRAAIGPAMYFGLMGDGCPLGRYDDMWAGWCSKVICDHLNLGVKTGLPYVHHSKASDPFVNLRKEYNGIFWQEACVDFFRGVKLSPAATDAATAYLELAAAVKKGLGPVDPYFIRLADAMEMWIEAWCELNPEAATATAAAAAATVPPPAPASAGAASADTAVAADGGVTVVAVAGGKGKAAPPQPSADDSDAVASPGAGRRVKRRSGA